MSQPVSWPLALALAGALWVGHAFAQPTAAPTEGAVAPATEPGSGTSMPPSPVPIRAVDPAEQTRMQAVRDVSRRKLAPQRDGAYAGLIGLMILRNGGPLPYAQR